MPQFDQVRTGATGLDSQLPTVGGGVRASNVHLVPRRARGVDGHGSDAGEGLEPADPTAARGHADGARDASEADFQKPGATANIAGLPDQCAQSAPTVQDRPNHCRNHGFGRGPPGRCDAFLANITAVRVSGCYGTNLTVQQSWLSSLTPVGVTTSFTHSGSVSDAHRCRKLCSHTDSSSFQQKNGVFDQQTNFATERRRLKLAKEISWLRTFFSGNFC